MIVVRACSLAPAPLSGRTVLVTGGNRGIGYELCRKLRHGGAKVVLTARDAEVGEKAKAGVEAAGTQGSPAVEVMPVDMADVRSIHGLASGQGQRGPVLLAQLMLPLLPDGAQVVMVSSVAGQLSGVVESHKYRSAVESASSIQELEAITFDPDSSMKNPNRYGAYILTEAMLNKATQLMAQDPAYRDRSIAVGQCCVPRLVPH